MITRIRIDPTGQFSFSSSSSSLTSYTYRWSSQLSSGMLWSAGLQGLWSVWKPPLWSINCDKTCSTFNSLTSTLLNNSSSCFLEILIFTSVVTVAKDPLSATKFQSSSLFSSLSYLQDDWCFKQFPILQEAGVCLYAKRGKGKRGRERRKRDDQGLLWWMKWFWKNVKMDRESWRIYRDGWWRVVTWEWVNPNLFHVRRCLVVFFLSMLSYVEKLWSNGAHRGKWLLLAFAFGFCLRWKRRLESSSVHGWCNAIGWILGTNI